MAQWLHAQHRRIQDLGFLEHEFVEVWTLAPEDFVATPDHWEMLRPVQAASWLRSVLSERMFRATYPARGLSQEGPLSVVM